MGHAHGGRVVEQKFSRRSRLALPFGHYRTVSFTVRQSTEAREIDATLSASLVDGTSPVPGVRERLGVCYVRRWSVRMNVSPY